MNYGTTTRTSTYTVVDVRKAFEGFAADLGMIAGRTKLWDTPKVTDMAHDVLKFAESYYLDQVDILLLDSADKPVRAARYSVNDKGSAISGDRPGGNDWPVLSNTRLTVLIRFTQKWRDLPEAEKQSFREGLTMSWGGTNMDTSYSHLQNQGAQQYASNGYEIKKENFK